MLALSLYPGKAVTFTRDGEHLATIHVRWIRGNKARLAFDAPRDIDIARIDSPPFPGEAPPVDAKDE